ncbi:MAG: ATP-dependent helicase HrpB, partial [Thermodesulfobacteriota bacterium]|nr:ATP-dependent helicase HrpB [Thermodesulfobacteriota bacterium]
MPYPNSLNPLPIDHILPELIETVLAKPAVVLQAPPGSGKTTRVPLALLEAIPAAQGRIIMLEPRRIAAVAAARWMAGILGEPVGKTIGYAIRFDRRISKDTRLEVVTEGILTRRLLDDPALEGVAMIIFDEFHERSLQADLALALSLDIQRGLREDLKLLVMSATIEAGPIAALLGNAPVIAAAGTSFPVAERYLGDNGRVGGWSEPPEDRIAGAVRIALRETTGDILVFLPGAGEIRRAAAGIQEILTGREDPVSLHPLYGDLHFAAQERAILPTGQRKIVLATNIAETSLTIEGVRVVIDGGQTRRLQYDPATGMNRLVTVTTSRASATQRQGRAGRLGPGTCYRLYSRHVH